MSTDRSRDVYGGLLIPMEQCTLDAVEDLTAITQAGPMVGEAVAQATTHGSLEASGSMTAGEHREIVVLRAGAPGRRLQSAGAGWRGAGEDLRGRDQPNLRAGWEVVRWVDGTGSGTQIVAMKHPRQVTLSTGVVVMVCETKIAGTIGGKYRVSVFTRALDALPSAPWDGPITLHNTVTAPVWGFRPCIAVDADDNLLVWHWVEDDEDDEAQIMVQASRDGGATWVTAARTVLPSAIDISSGTGVMLGQLSAAIVDAEVVLFAEIVSRNVLLPFIAIYQQYHSTTGGLSFDLIEEGTGDGPTGAHEVLVLGGVVHVVHVGSLAGDDEGLYCTTLASPSEPLSGGEEHEIDTTGQTADYSATTGYLDNATDIAACVDDDGVLYVVATATTNSGYLGGLVIFRSEDDAITWTSMGLGLSTFTTDASAIYYDGTLTHRPRHLNLTPQSGGLLLAHTHVSASGDHDGSVSVTRLGGWTNRNAPGLAAFPRPQDRVGWTRSWLPFGVPEDMGWTKTSSGGKTWSVTSDAELHVDATSGTCYASRSPTASTAKGIGGQWVLRVDNASNASLYQGVLLRVADGLNDYQIQIRVRDDEIDIWDVHAGGSLGTITLDCTEAVHLMAWLRRDPDDTSAGADGHVYVCARTYINNGDRYFDHEVADLAVVSDTATPAATNLVAWGAVVASTSESWWTLMDSTESQAAGRSMASGWDDDDIVPGPLTAYPFRYGGGLRIHAVRGPMAYGDEWHVDAEYAAGLRHGMATVTPTRARKHLTTSSASDLRIPITLAADDISLPAAIALFAVGVEAPQMFLEGWDGSSWATLAYGNTWQGRQGTYRLYGTTMVPTAGTDWTVYTAPQALAGCVVEMDDGINPPVLRRLLRNDGGVWDAGQPAQQERLVLDPDDIDGSEPATGTLRVWSRSIALIAHLPSTSRYRKLALRLPAATTPDDAFALEAWAICEVVIPDMPPEAARVRSLEPGTELTVHADQTVSALEVARPRRVLELPWTSLLPIHHVQGTSPAPSYLKATTAAGGRAVANWGAAPLTLEGVLRRLNGARSMVAWVDGITRTSATSQSITGEEAIIYGRITTEIRREQAGRHAERIRGITLREEL